MDKGLKRNAFAGVDNIFNDKLINVYDIATKSVVFTGNNNDVANYFGVGYTVIGSVMRTKKKRYKNKYALRLVPEK